MEGAQPPRTAPPTVELPHDTLVRFGSSRESWQGWPSSRPSSSPACPSPNGHPCHLSQTSQDALEDLPNVLSPLDQFQRGQFFKARQPIHGPGPKPLSDAARGDPGILALLAHGHPPLCPHPGWPAGALSHRRQIFADRENALSLKPLSRCLRAQEVKQGAEAGEGIAHSLTPVGRPRQWVTQLPTPVKFKGRARRPKPDGTLKTMEHNGSCHVTARSTAAPERERAGPEKTAPEQDEGRYQQLLGELPSTSRDPSDAEHKGPRVRGVSGSAWGRGAAVQCAGQRLPQNPGFTPQIHAASARTHASLRLPPPPRSLDQRQ